MGRHGKKRARSSSSQPSSHSQSDAFPLSKDVSRKRRKEGKEPFNEDSGRSKQSHSSQRRMESSQAKPEDDSDPPVRWRRNRWRNKEENVTSISRPIKHEPNSEGKKSDPHKVEKIQAGQKEKPNFGLSGKFIKYSEPPEARKPKLRWRLHPFKGDKGLPPLYIHRQSAYLIGKDRSVADIPVDHASCSKQHAALQYRLVPSKLEDGTSGVRVKPYIIDLKSTNGTFVNNIKLEPRTYIELIEKDVIRFGYSSREYVFTHEESTDSGRSKQSHSSQRRMERSQSKPEHDSDSSVRGSRNQWGNEQENVTNMSRPIKHELNSEGKEEYEWGKKSGLPKEEKIQPGKKEKPNFGLSGKLAENTNIFNGVFIKYSEPPEARKSKLRWRLYPFKGGKCLPTLYIHKQSAYLIGRDRRVADFPVDHPSCSNQHAALQYRLVPFKREDGTSGYRVKPYIIDLESTNGTFVNNIKIEPRRYVELIEKDVIKFGSSSREYVLLHEGSAGEQLDDGVATAGTD